MFTSQRSFHNAKPTNRTEKSCSLGGVHISGVFTMRVFIVYMFMYECRIISHSLVDVRRLVVLLLLSATIIRLQGWLPVPLSSVSLTRVCNIGGGGRRPGVLDHSIMRTINRLCHHATAHSPQATKHSTGGRAGRSTLDRWGSAGAVLKRPALIGRGQLIGYPHAGVGKIFRKKCDGICIIR